MFAISNQLVSRCSFGHTILFFSFCNEEKNEAAGLSSQYHLMRRLVQEVAHVYVITHHLHRTQNVRAGNIYFISGIMADNKDYEGLAVAEW